MKPKHTPGKWREQVRECMHTADSTTFDIVSHAAKGGTLIAVVEDDGIGGDESAANATLIAAAPAHWKPTERSSKCSPTP